MPHRRSIAVTATSALLAVSCVPGGGMSPSGSGATPSVISAPARGWTVGEREHVDLWLHGFAMLTSDTARVPFFERGYRQRLTALKRQQNLYTNLDANADQLSARFTTNPSLTNAQFLAMYFPSWQEIVNATNALMVTNGDPRGASDPQMQSELALLAAYFPSPADRDWLRLFVQSLQDESTRFYHAYWTAEQQHRAGVRAAFEARWRETYYHKFSGYLNNSQQSAGDFLLSLPLDGEGRTLNNANRTNTVSTVFPSAEADTLAPLYVFAHEVINKVTDVAIKDNTTPAEQRSGEVARFAPNVTVRGGALLLQRIAPELVPGYMRYYLRAIGASARSTDTAAAFASSFPVPDVVLSAIGRQLDAVLGGI